MSSGSQSEPIQDLLCVQLHPAEIPVSYLSSLLRVVQAALREVARANEETRPAFDRNPQPLLILSRVETEDDLTLYFTFADPDHSTPLEQLSSQTFDAFLDRFGEFIKGLPQPGLWGGAARRPSQHSMESPLGGRMDQVYQELRRSPRATLRFRDRTIEVEGARMEIV